jgi:hypothetical protein
MNKVGEDMKHTCTAVLLIILTLMLSACSHISKSKSEKLAQQFINATYNFQDTKQIVDNDTFYKARDKFAENLEPFMTKNAYKKLSIDNDPYKIIEIAAKERVIIGIENIKLKISKAYKDEGTLHYEFTGDVILTPIENSKLEYNKIAISGELKISKESNALKISYFKMNNSSEWVNILNELKNLN